MARGRFISESVAKDLRLNSLSVEAQLVYLMTIPHLDRDGLIEGDTDVLYGTVCPKRRVFIDRIDEFIQEWVQAGLVVRYDCNDGPVLWFKGFTKNQQGLRYDRETPSKFPPPPDDAPPNDDNIRQNDGGVRQMSARADAHARPESQVKVEVKSQVEVKAEAEEPAALAAAAIDPDVARLWTKWDANMPGTKTPVIVDGVNALLNDYAVAEIEQAIVIACKQNKRSLRYIEGILAKGAFSQAPSNSNGAKHGTYQQNNQSHDEPEYDPEIQKRMDEHRAKRKAEGSLYYQ